MTTERRTTALKLGATLHTRLGSRAFLPGDLAIDLMLDVPGDSVEAYHANLGIGAEAGDDFIVAHILSFGLYTTFD